MVRSVIPKGFSHLNPRTGNSHPISPSRLPHTPKQYVPPTDRIRKWNIRVGDKVRLIVGKPSEKFIDEDKGKDGGWKVYKVKDTDMKKSRVYLEGVSNKRSNTIKPLPENFESLSAEEKLTFESQSGQIDLARPIHYSNVQLCVEENGENSVFASRISTGSPQFIRADRKLVWRRYAAKLTGESSITPDQDKGLVRIPWPTQKERPNLAPGYQETTRPLADTVTFIPASSEHLSMVAQVPDFPRTLRSPAPTNQSWSNEYLVRDRNIFYPDLDTFMPLYLSEELSPRFSKAKQTKGWNLRRQIESQERKTTVKDQVELWRIGGKDQGLESVLESDEVGLEGLTIRQRTTREVREDARAAFDEELKIVKKEVQDARRDGKVWVGDEELKSESSKEGWVDGEKGVKLAIRKGRKERKERRILEKLEKLRLEPGRNTVVPKTMTA